MLYHITEFSNATGIPVQTLRNWDSSGKLKPFTRSKTGVGQYSSSQVDSYLLNVKAAKQELAIGYCFMYENDNVDLLSNRVEKIKQYMVSKNYKYEIKSKIIFHEDKLKTDVEFEVPTDVSHIVVIAEELDQNIEMLSKLLQFELGIDVVVLEENQQILEVEPEPVSFKLDVKGAVLDILSSLESFSNRDALELSKYIIDFSNKK